MSVSYRVGDTRDVIATIPDGSVSLVASSPPFIALRSYLPADHPDKHREIGSEPDPATFIDTLLALTADWGRVLAPWGSIAIELGDTYAGSGGAGGDYNPGGIRQGQGVFDGSSRREQASDHKYAGEWANPGFGDGFKGGNPGGNGWPRPKCLALVPQAYALSLAYGRNVLNGNPSPAGQWLVRNQIVWHRPNPAVGALGDKFRPSTSYITVATRSAKRWFDLTAVRTPTNGKAEISRDPDAKRGQRDGSWQTLGPYDPATTAGAPPLDCWFDEHDTWTITTQPSSLAHYAMWPAKLAERLILSMCPAEVCFVCGEPRRRVEKRDAAAVALNHVARNGRAKDGRGDEREYDGYGGFTTTTTTTLGWTDCGHDAFVPGTVLDPFAGTGTTLAVADLHGRDAIGIDVDERNPALYPARRAECARNLFGSPAVDHNQLDLFGTL